MTSSQSIRDTTCQKLRGVGLPKEVVLPLVDLITRQVQAEGAENVVTRLKALKLAAVHSLAGSNPKFPWIAHTAKGPKGPWRPVWRMLHASSHKHRKRALNALMVYANFVLPKSAGPTKAQERKFLGSVVQPGVSQNLSWDQAKALRASGTLEGLKRLRGHLHANGWRALKDSQYEAVDLVDFLMQVYGANTSMADGVRKAERQINTFIHKDAGRAFQPFPMFVACLGMLAEDDREITHPWHRYDEDWRDAEPPTQPIGLVGYTHEPGLKFRAFAAPNRVLQATLEPDKRLLLAALKAMPWDCTHDQGSGVDSVRTWLQEGKTVYSVDLSDATNNFPLDLQLEVLHELGVPEQHTRFMWMVARSPYTKAWGDCADITWTKGQPLGAAPSFPMFALAHSVVALASEAAVGIPADQLGSTFRVLGDDFVCSDERVHAEYRKRLAILGCPISEPKCLVSNLAGEFAGKVITAGPVYHGYKYRELSDRSFMDQIRTLGSQAISPVFLTPRQLAYAKLVKEFPEPFGLGFNPRGLPLSQRYAESLVVQEALATPDPTPDVTRARLRNFFFHGVKSPWYTMFDANERDRLAPESPCFDPRTPEGVMRLIKGESVVQQPVKTGDPRPLPAFFEAKVEKGYARLKQWRADPEMDLINTAHVVVPSGGSYTAAEAPKGVVITGENPDARDNLLARIAKDPKGGCEP